MTEPLVSILLPTIRPDLFRLRMAEYANVDWPGPCEIVVVSDRPDLDVSSPHPLVTMQHFLQSRQGNVPATNLAFEKSTGRYVFATNDEVELDPQIFKALLSAGEANGEAGIFSASQTPYCSNDYYGVFFANCPFGLRGFFQQLNGGERLFDSVYSCFYADPDLSLRAHAVGFYVVKVQDAICTHHLVYNADGHASNRSAYYERDRQTFLHRWEHLGPEPVDPSLR